MTDPVSTAREAIRRTFQWRDGHADLWSTFEDGPALGALVDGLAALAEERRPGAIAGIEARGFALGAPVAAALGLGFHAIRKEGALFPGPKAVRAASPDYRGRQHSLALRTTLPPGTRVVLVDDWIETGSQALAARGLTEECGATWAGAVVAVGDVSAQADAVAALAPVTWLVSSAELGDSA